MYFVILPIRWTVNEQSPKLPPNPNQQNFSKLEELTLLLVDTVFVLVEDNFEEIGSSHLSNDFLVHK